MIFKGISSTSNRQGNPQAEYQGEYGERKIYMVKEDNKQTHKHISGWFCLSGEI